MLKEWPSNRLELLPLPKLCMYKDTEGSIASNPTDCKTWGLAPQLPPKGPPRLRKCDKRISERLTEDWCFEVGKKIYTTQWSSCKLHNSSDDKCTRIKAIIGQFKLMLREDFSQQWAQRDKRDQRKLHRWCYLANMLASKYFLQWGCIDIKTRLLAINMHNRPIGYWTKLKSSSFYQKVDNFSSKLRIYKGKHQVKSHPWIWSDEISTCVRFRPISVSEFWN